MSSHALALLVFPAKRFLCRAIACPAAYRHHRQRHGWGLGQKRSLCWQGQASSTKSARMVAPQARLATRTKGGAYERAASPISGAIGVCYGQGVPVGPPSSWAVIRVANGGLVGYGGATHPRPCQSPAATTARKSTAERAEIFLDCACPATCKRRELDEPRLRRPRRPLGQAQLEEKAEEMNSHQHAARGMPSLAQPPFRSLESTALASMFARGLAARAGRAHQHIPATTTGDRNQ